MDLIFRKKDLPHGWTLTELKELVNNPQKDIVDGPFGSNLKAGEYTQSGIPVFKIQNIKANRFIDNNINYVTEKKAKELHRHSFKSGDLIITKLGYPLGLCCKVPDKYSYGIIVADLIRFRPNNDIIVDNYLIYIINSYIIQSQFKTITKGTTRPRVNLTIVRSIKLPLAPLAEQHRIVAKIEELFSNLDKGIESLKKAQAQLKTYRQAVLKYAFEGKLTQEWRKKNKPEPAEKLLEQIRAEREKQYKKQLKEWEEACKKAKAEGKKKPVKPKKPKELLPITELDLPELPDSWSWTRLGETAHKIQIGPFGSQLHKEDYREEGIPIINPKHIKNQRIYPKERISQEKADSLSQYFLLKNDIILGRRGEMGRSAPIADDMAGWFCGTGSLYIRLGDSYISKLYSLILSERRIVDYLETHSRGTTMTNLNSQILNSLPIQIIPISEQHAIVQETESRLSVCDKLEQTVEDSLKKAEALRQSILKKAFEGRLVPQYPNDEPAEKLLERIKAEKEKNN
ncbi:MAG: hypothetical protein GY749_17415 [Desulfobacteraceae bacterium]|nr:hypothetical protein [Desulfobacteraceae bacterium]